jgi:hypothetical protein
MFLFLILPAIASAVSAFVWLYTPDGTIIAIKLLSSL